MISITMSVGSKGSNRVADVKAIQELINKSLSKIAPTKALVVDGVCGNKTIAAIKEFQRKVCGFSSPDGRVDPGKTTLNVLNKTASTASAASTASGGSVDAKKIKNGRITNNFTLAEFACKDGTPVPSQYVPNTIKLAQNLQILRDTIRKSIRITSGYRSPSYNRKVGGASKSQHMLGTAADIVVSGMSARTVAAKIEELIKSGKMKQGGLGRYNSFTHYDIRNYKARW